MPARHSCWPQRCLTALGSKQKHSTDQRKMISGNKPACYRWLSVQHLGARCHQIQPFKTVSSLPKMVAGLSFKPHWNIWEYQLFSHTPAVLGGYFCCSKWPCCLEQSDIWLVTCFRPWFISHPGWLWVWLSLRPRLGALLLHSPLQTS